MEYLSRTSANSDSKASSGRDGSRALLSASSTLSVSNAKHPRIAMKSGKRSTLFSNGATAHRLSGGRSKWRVVSLGTTPPTILPRPSDHLGVGESSRFVAFRDDSCSGGARGRGGVPALTLPRMSDAFNINTEVIIM